MTRIPSFLRLSAFHCSFCHFDHVGLFSFAFLSDWTLPLKGCQFTNNLIGCYDVGWKTIFVFKTVWKRNPRSKDRIIQRSLSLLGGLVQFRFEVLSLALLMVWGLGFATGLTANYTVKLEPGIQCHFPLDRWIP